MKVLVIDHDIKAGICLVLEFFEDRCLWFEDRSLVYPRLKRFINVHLEIGGLRIIVLISGKVWRLIEVVYGTVELLVLTKRCKS